MTPPDEPTAGEPNREGEREGGAAAESAGTDELMDDLADEPTPESPRRRRRWRRVLVVTVGLLFSLVLLAAGGLYVISDRLAGNVERIPSVFTPLDPAERPTKPPGVAGEAETFLLAGSDSLSDEPTTGSDAHGAQPEPGAQRSDVIMLVRVNAARTAAVVVSIPRDSWVAVPGHGMAKVNAAYAYGGPTLLVRTAEALTKVRVDHFATIDFAGFRAMVDAVGGIDVTVAERTTFGETAFEPGHNHLDGQRALAYVRQRTGLPEGDLSRVQRQQNALRALLTKAVSSGMLRNPARLYDLLDAVSRSVGVDDTLSNGDLRSLAYELRNLRTGAVTFLTSPVAGLGREGEQSVVYLDRQRAARLWHALDHDRINDYLKDNGGDMLSGNPP
jgi:LCP family protein required for cell wall assembly